MDLCLEPGGQRMDTLHQMQELLQQLLGAADQLNESLLAVHICHALDQAEQSIRQASASAA